MITQEFDLNLIPNSDPVVVHVDQYDRGTGRLIISLYNGDMPYTPDGTAVIQGCKPDGHGFEYPAELSENVVTANLTEQMTAVAGDVRTQIVVTESTGRTGTFVFTLAVQASALPSDAEMSASEYTAIQEAIEDSEAWARGTRGGQDVPSSDETYHNNSKYYAELAAQAAGEGGHIILDESGNEMPTRPKLQFENSTVTDDAVNNKTIVSTGTASGGSIIKVHTTEATLYGEDVTLTDGVETMTATFDNSGDATFSAVMLTGDLTIESTDGSLTAIYHLTANYFGVYNVTLTFWTATIEVSTDTAEFDTLTVRAVKNGVTYGSGTFDNGEATVTVPEAGEYTIVVDYSWAQYTATVNVVAETTYTTSVNAFFATVSLTTSTPEFANLPIYVTWDGDPVTGTAFSSGSATFTALEAGTYVFSVSYGGETYTATQVVTSETTYSLEIKMWVATITVTTTSLYGKTVTVKKSGTTVATNTLDSVTGSCVLNVHETGTYSVEVNDTDYSYIYTDSVVVSEETDYPVTINSFNATLSLSTTSPELASSLITITKGAETIGTVYFVNSAATFMVHETGTYTCTCTYQGDDYSKDVTVSSATTYPVAINTTITVTVTLYGAVEDTISYTDYNGSQVQTFGTGESSKSGVSITVSPDSPNVTFTSAVAKNPADITLDYTRTVEITDGMTEIYVMPVQPIYWYGYEPNAFQAYAYKPSDSGSTTVMPSISRSTNSLTMTLRGSNTYNYGIIAQSVPVELQDMNTLCIIGSGTETSLDVRTAYLISAVSNSFSWSVETKFPTSTGFVASAIPSEAYTYPAIAANAPANTTKTIVVNAFWLDDTIQIYSAAEDDVYIINNGVTIPLCHTDSTGLGFVSKDKLPVGTYTIYSSVAKNPSSLSDAYSKSVTVTSGTTEIYLMPEGSILYWYGYIVPSFTTAAYGWSGSSGSRKKPTESRSTNYVSLTQQEAYIGVWYTDSYSIGTNNTSNAIVELGTAQYGMSVLVIDSATFANNYTVSNGIRDHSQEKSQTLFLSSTNANISDSTRGVGIETLGSTIKVYALWLSEEVIP